MPAVARQAGRGTGATRCAAISPIASCAAICSYARCCTASPEGVTTPSAETTPVASANVEIAVGPERDVAAEVICDGMRNRDHRALARRVGGKSPLQLEGLPSAVQAALDDIQAGLLSAARERREAASIRGVTKERLIAFMKEEGGFAYGGFCGDGACEAAIKQETAATVRILPDPEFRSPPAPKACVWCGKPSVAEAVWAQAY